MRGWGAGKSHVFRKCAAAYVETRHVFRRPPLFKFFDRVWNDTLLAVPCRAVPLLSSPVGLCCLAALCLSPSSPRFSPRSCLPSAGKQLASRSRPTESYFPTYVCTDESEFIWVEGRQRRLFLFGCLLLYAYPPNRVCLRQYGYFLQTFGLGLHSHTANISCHQLEALFSFVFLNFAKGNPWYSVLFHYFMDLFNVIKYSECVMQNYIFSGGNFSKIFFVTE